MNILGLGFPRNDCGIECVEYGSNRSLLNGDIAVVCGPLNLGTNVIQPWTPEIFGALESGRNVFLILEQVSTQLLKNLNIPNTAKSGVRIDCKVKLQALDDYWRDFSEKSRFELTLDGLRLEDGFYIHNTEVLVGGVLRQSKANLIFLPNISLGDFTLSHLNLYPQNAPSPEKLHALIEDLKRHLILIDSSLKGAPGAERRPEWTQSYLSNSPRGVETMSQLEKAEEELRSAETNLQHSLEAMHDEKEWLDLLSGTGKALEAAVRRAMTLLGFENSRFEDGDLEFDLVFEFQGKRFIGEVEGKDAKAVNLTKARQLKDNLEMDFERQGEDGSYATGILFGNAFRLSDPKERQDRFTRSCLTSAKQGNLILIATEDLYEPVQYLRASNDAGYREACQKAILASHGRRADIPKPK